MLCNSCSIRISISSQTLRKVLQGTNINQRIPDCKSESFLHGSQKRGIDRKKNHQIHVTDLYHNIKCQWKLRMAKDEDQQCLKMMYQPVQSLNYSDLCHIKKAPRHLQYPARHQRKTFSTSLQKEPRFLYLQPKKKRSNIHQVFSYLTRAKLLNQKTKMYIISFKKLQRW